MIDSPVKVVLSDSPMWGNAPFSYVIRPRPGGWCQSQTTLTVRVRSCPSFYGFFFAGEGVGFGRFPLIGRKREKSTACFGFPSIRVTLPSRYLLTAELGCNPETDGCRGVI